MQLIEVTLGAETTRPGPVQYSSDKKSAFAKIAIHPGDKLDDVLAEGRRILAQALGQQAEPDEEVVAEKPTPDQRSALRAIVTRLKDAGINVQDIHPPETRADADELLADLQKRLPKA